MSKKIIAVALDINKIPYVNETEVILTPGVQKIWYTAKTVPITIPGYIKFGDNIINSFLKKFVKKSSKHDILMFNYFTNRVSRYIKKNSYDDIIFENDKLKSAILPNFENKNEYVANKKEALPIEW